MLETPHELLRYQHHGCFLKSLKLQEYSLRLCSLSATRSSILLGKEFTYLFIFQQSAASCLGRLFPRKMHDFHRVKVFLLPRLREPCSSLCSSLFPECKAERRKHVVSQKHNHALICFMHHSLNNFSLGKKGKITQYCYCKNQWDIQSDNKKKRGVGNKICNWFPCIPDLDL